MNHPRFSIWDLDDTLFEGDCYTPEECLAVEPIPKHLEAIKKRYETSVVIIYTARRDYLIPATFEWLRKHGIRWHFFSNIKVPFMGKPGETEYVDVVNKRPDEL